MIFQKDIKNYMEFERQIAEQLNIRPNYVSATIDLLDNDNTVPFIARYRKEATGGLDEDQLRKLSAMLESIRALMKRRSIPADRYGTN